MNLRWIILFVFLITNFSAIAAETKKTDNRLKTKEDKISYSLGASIGADLKRQNIPLNPEILYIGIKDSINDSLLITQEEMDKVLLDFQKKQIAENESKLKQLAKDNLAKSKKFLTKNKTKKGIKSLPSGLQYKIIEPGKGSKPKITDTVTVNYKGTLLNGREFDSSYKRNKPATFKLNQVIQGWQQALQIMSPGSKLKLFVPPKLAYGEKGIGNIIEPNSLLIFEVELIKINKEAKKENKL